MPLVPKMNVGQPVCAAAYRHHSSVRVTDLLGNTLMEAAYDDATSWSIDLHGQAGGVYMVTVTVDGVSYFGKLVLW